MPTRRALLVSHQPRVHTCDVVRVKARQRSQLLAFFVLVQTHETLIAVRVVAARRSRRRRGGGRRNGALEATRRQRGNVVSRGAL